MGYRSSPKFTGRGPSCLEPVHRRVAVGIAGGATARVRSNVLTGSGVPGPTASTHEESSRGRNGPHVFARSSRMETVRKEKNEYSKIFEIFESVSVRIRSVFILTDGNWKETQIWLFEISESISVRIRSVSILTQHGTHVESTWRTRGVNSLF